MVAHPLFRVTKTSINPGSYLKDAGIFEIVAYSRRLREPAWMMRTLGVEGILAGDTWPGRFLSAPFPRVDEDTVEKCLSILDREQGVLRPLRMRRDVTVDIHEDFHISLTAPGENIPNVTRMDAVWLHEIITHLLPGLDSGKTLALMERGDAAGALRMLEEPVLQGIENPAVWNSLRLMLKQLGHESSRLRAALAGVKQTCFAHEYDIPKVVISRVRADREGRSGDHWVRGEVTRPGELEPTAISIFDVRDNTLKNLIGWEFARELKYHFSHGSPARASFSWVEDDLIGHE